MSKNPIAFERCVCLYVKSQGGIWSTPKHGGDGGLIYFFLKNYEKKNKYELSPHCRNGLWSPLAVEDVT